MAETPAARVAVADPVSVTSLHSAPVELTQVGEDLEACRESCAAANAACWILLAWPAGVSAAYPSSMVNPSLQSAIEALSIDERLELVEYIESTVESSPIEVTEEQKTMIGSRAAELQADPSIGLTWDEIKARLAARRA